jgi:hypothetical protein
MHEQFGAAVSESSTMLDRLKSSWDDPQTIQLLEQCKASEKRDANLSPGKDIPLWGWAKKTEQLTETQHEERLADFDFPQEEAVLDEFKDSSLEWNWIDDSKSTINVKVKGPGLNMVLHVTRKRGPEGIIYEAECVGDTKEKHAISRCLSRRPLKMDLKFLLVYHLL